MFLFFDLTLVFCLASLSVFLFLFGGDLPSFPFCGPPWSRCLYPLPHPWYGVILARDRLLPLSASVLSVSNRRTRTLGRFPMHDDGKP
jgi:hypothetical protein